MAVNVTPLGSMMVAEVVVNLQVHSPGRYPPLISSPRNFLPLKTIGTSGMALQVKLHCAKGIDP